MIMTVTMIVVVVVIEKIIKKHLLYSSSEESPSHSTDRPSSPYLQFGTLNRARALVVLFMGHNNKAVLYCYDFF